MILIFWLLICFFFVFLVNLCLTLPVLCCAGVCARIARGYRADNEGPVAVDGHLTLRAQLTAI